MSDFKTSTTVQEHGQILVAGVPFEPGTRVAVTITPATNGTESPQAEERDRAVRLLAALDKARNTAPVGPLRRTELYDRDVVH